MGSYTGCALSMVGYQPKQMMGPRIGAWAGLPIEAVCVWIAVTYATVIVFEIVKLWQASEKPAKDAFLGLKNSPRRRLKIGDQRLSAVAAIVDEDCQPRFVPNWGNEALRL